MNKLTSTSIVINDSVIEKVSHFKYLGIILDENFSFAGHSEYLLKKCTTALGMMDRFKRFLLPTTVTILINAYVCCNVDYCPFCGDILALRILM